MITSLQILKIRFHFMMHNALEGLFEALQTHYFEQKGKTIFCSSRKRVGRQSLPNRLMFMREIDYPWNEQEIICQMA